MLGNGVECFLPWPLPQTLHFVPHSASALQAACGNLAPACIPYRVGTAVPPDSPAGPVSTLRTQAHPARHSEPGTGPGWQRAPPPEVCSECSWRHSCPQPEATVTAARQDAHGSTRPGLGPPLGGRASSCLCPQYTCPRKAQRGHAQDEHNEQPAASWAAPWLRLPADLGGGWQPPRGPSCHSNLISLQGQDGLPVPGCWHKVPRRVNPGAGLEEVGG